MASNLPESGISLVAQGAGQFINTVERANAATLKFTQDTVSGATQASSAYAKLATSAGASVARITGLSEKLSLQQRAFALLQQEVDATAQKYGAASIQAQKKQLALDKLGAAIRQTESALDAEQGALNRTEAEMRNAARGAGQLDRAFHEIATGALRQVGQMLTNVLGNALQSVAQWAGNAIGAAGDFEQTMSVLGAQSGATGAQMQQVAANAKALGADLTLPATSASDAATAMLELSKGGLSVEQSMAAAKGTLQLAAAAETDVATAANLMTGALAAFGMEGNQATKVADLLTNAANKSRASISDVSLGFQQAAFRFKSAGQGADDLAASLTILIQAGLGGSDAGTALQNAIARLQGPTDKAAELMSKLGINVYDAQGNMLPMERIIGVLNKAFEGMTQEQRNAALQTIFLSDGMKAMIPLLDAGASGFATVKGEMNESGAAAKMAGAQMKGLKGAAAGLSSQIETLSQEAFEPLLPVLTGAIKRVAEFAGSLVGKVGPAVLEAIRVVKALADGITNSFIPVLKTLIATTAIYALINLPAMIAAIGTATAAVATMAAGMLAALGPLALIALAVGGIVVQANRLQAEITKVTDRVLEGSKEWKAAVGALEAYDAASDKVKAGAAEEAEALRKLQDAQRAAIEQYARHVSAYQTFGIASGQTASSLEAERQAINARGEAIVSGTAALQREMDLYGQMDGRRESIELMTASHEGLSTAVQANAIDYDALTKEIEETFVSGTKAISDYVGAAITFQAEFTKAVREGNAEQAAAAASNYAEQAAAARASLGEQLAAFTIAYAKMNNINDETTRAILVQIEKTFGTTGNIAATTMLDLEGHIKTAMSEGGASVEGLGGKLDATTGEAIELKQRMDALKGQYEAQLIQNFKDGKIDADELRAALEKIPAKVYSEVTVTTTYVEERRSSGQEGGLLEERARGGSVRRGTPYMVGEKGRELFVPGQNGTIMTARETAKIMNAYASTTSNPVAIAPPPTVVVQAPQTTTTSYQMPIYTNQSPAVLSQGLAIIEAMV